jgi:hypothetical protein
VLHRISGCSGDLSSLHLDLTTLCRIAKSGRCDHSKEQEKESSDGFSGFHQGAKIEPGFFPDIALKKAIKSRQINRLPTSLASGNCLLAASASRVAAKLARIRIIVMVRRNQRSEVCNEIRVVINMDIPFMPATLWMSYLPCFDDEAGDFRYKHDANVRN